MNEQCTPFLSDYTDEDVDILARTIYGEARGESMVGKQAVAWVVVNRARRGGWWGDTIAGVCLKPWQFSCWNENDPNREKLLSVASDNAVLMVCRRAALEVLEGGVPDPTEGACHYHVDGLEPLPHWQQDALKRVSIGAHVFCVGVR